MSETENYIFRSNTLVDLYIIQFGRELCHSLQLYGPAKRNHYLIHFILKGRGCFQSDNTLHSLLPGQAFLITPDIPTTYHADEKDPWEYIWLEFDGLKAPEFLKQAGLSREQPVYKPVSSAVGNTPADILLNMLQHHDEDIAYLIGQLYLFCSALNKNSGNPQVNHSETLKDFYIREALQYVYSHYFEEITVEQMAFRCGLNRTYFSKLFKDAMQVTPQEFILRYRIIQACEMLSKTSMPINEIAVKVGYSNPLHFSRAFKNKQGISPRLYRYENHL